MLIGNPARRAEVSLVATFVLIDFENVQPKDLDALGGGAFKVIVFAGAKQERMKTDLVASLLKHGAELVQAGGTGRNALDMHIAYTIGRLAAEQPDAAFHIISKDRDYDPLIAHLKKKGISCTRHATASGIAHPRSTPPKPAPKSPAAATAKPRAKPAKPAATKALADRVARVIQDLKKRAPARPATRKALVATIRHLLRGIADEDVTAIVNELTLRGEIAIERDKVGYPSV